MEPKIEDFESRKAIRFVKGFHNSTSLYFVLIIKEKNL